MMCAWLRGRQQPGRRSRLCLFVFCAVPPEVAAYRAKLDKMKGIINGKTPVALYLDFLYRWVLRLKYLQLYSLLAGSSIRAWGGYAFLCAVVKLV